MARSIIIPLIALILSCGVLINGCLNHSRLPSEEEKRLFQQHSEVIVLLRLRTVVDGKPREEIRLKEKEGRCHVWICGRDQDARCRSISFFSHERAHIVLISPSARARRQGWY